MQLTSKSQIEKQIKKKDNAGWESKRWGKEAVRGSEEALQRHTAKHKKTDKERVEARMQIRQKSSGIYQNTPKGTQGSH